MTTGALPGAAVGSGRIVGDGSGADADGPVPPVAAGSVVADELAPAGNVAVDVGIGVGVAVGRAELLGAGLALAGGLAAAIGPAEIAATTGGGPLATGPVGAASNGDRPSQAATTTAVTEIVTSGRRSAGLTDGALAT